MEEMRNANNRKAGTREAAVALLVAHIGTMAYLRGFPGESVPLFNGERVAGLLRGSPPQVCRQLCVLPFPPLEERHFPLHK
jgi:hypothetical protein